MMGHQSIQTVMRIFKPGQSEKPSWPGYLAAIPRAMQGPKILWDFSVVRLSSPTASAESSDHHGNDDGGGYDKYQ